MDLSTTYLGLPLKHPVVPSSSPLSYELDGIRRLEDAGASAIVMHSLFEEQITQDNQLLDHQLGYRIESHQEALSYFPDMTDYEDPEAYLELIREAKAAVDIPLIGSLNGVTAGGWTRYAAEIEQAGADALELNIYYLPTSPQMTSVEVERVYLDILRDVKEGISIPVAVKLNPYFSAPANVALRLARAGAGGLVLFNRFYQPDFDLVARQVNLQLVLSQSPELRLPLRWVAILYGRIPADLAISSGVHTYEDVLKGIMAGAKVTMMTSELLQRGPQRIGEIVGEMSQWLEAEGHGSIGELQGTMSQIKVTEPSAFERANYLKMLRS